MWLCAFTGFASGLPLYLLLQLVPGWLRRDGVSLTEIGFFTLVTLPYTWKFIWSPLLERYYQPRIGRRRSWMLLTQAGLVLGIASLGVWEPAQSLYTIAAVACVVSVFSATQDIALDAYRRELLESESELALGNTVHVQVYRLAGLVPGSLGFVLSDHLPWDVVFFVMAAFMVVPLLITLTIREAVAQPTVPTTLYEATVVPFRDFFQRSGPAHAWLVLAFLFFYKLGDTMATALSTPFFIDMGFTQSQIGLIAKNASLWAAIVGAVVGSLIIMKTGINRALWYFGVVQVVTIFGFVWLSEVGNNPWVLGVAIAAEYLGVGLGTAAFVGYIARETNPAMAATQFALFTALTALPRSLASATTGAIVDSIGWTPFFYLCVALALPGMALLPWAAPYARGPNSGSTADAPPTRDSAGDSD